MIQQGWGGGNDIVEPEEVKRYDAHADVGEELRRMNLTVEPLP